jgi:hypothetical protein
MGIFALVAILEGRELVGKVLNAGIVGRLDHREGN